MPQNSTQAAQRGPVRFGRWQDVLADVECDALICDPPYSAQTHECADELTRRDTGKLSKSTLAGPGIAPDYAAFTVEDVHAFVEAWAPRCRGWMVCLTDSNFIQVYKDAYQCGRSLRIRAGALRDFGHVDSLIRRRPVELDGLRDGFTAARSIVCGVGHVARRIRRQARQRCRHGPW